MVDTEVQDDAIVGKRGNVIFPESDIPVLLPNNGSTRGFVRKEEITVPEGATVGVRTGSVIGETAEVLAGIGELAVLGTGSFIAAGPILVALSGAAIGVGVCGLTGALLRLGIPKCGARQDIAASQAAAQESAPKKKVQVTPTTEQIQVRAFFIAERRKALGLGADDTGDWAQAEREIQAEGTGK
jgi:hypothetical protein